MSKKILSPLRYPGGKSRAVSILDTYIPAGTNEICSPFFGGGSFELFCANKGIKVYGYDVFQPLVDFWQSLLYDKQNLIAEVKNWHPISKEDFYKLQNEQSNLKTRLERGATFFVLNRSSFSGSTLSGGMSPDHPRFNLSSIERLNAFDIHNFSVDHKSFEDSILLHPKQMLYLDPPYLISGALYGKDGDTHRNFDHSKLLSILKTRQNWILSYNNSEEIKDMYKGYQMTYPEWKYGMSNDKDSKEILILSNDLTLPK